MSNMIAALVFTSVVAVVPVNLAGPAASRDARPATAAPKTAQEKHPRIRAALTALDAAKAELKAAAHDFGGHRVEAIKALDAATAQLKLALDYDKK